MQKQGTLFLMLGALIGANLIMAAWLVSLSFAPAAIGATADSGNNFAVATGRLQGRGEADAFYIWDHQDKKLLVYAALGNKFELIAVRDAQWDLRYQEYPGGNRHSPTLDEVRKDQAKAGGGPK